MRCEPKPARAHSWVCGGERNERIRKLENGARVTSLHLRKLTLPKFETWAKFEMKKRRIETVRRIRKETECFERAERGFLMKKGCKMGGVSL